MTAWEAAARLFEPEVTEEHQLWLKRPWSAYLTEPDRLTLEGDGTPIAYVLPGVDLRKLK